MSGDTTDNLTECARCGHIEYHHRPECTYREAWMAERSAGSGTRCRCPEFVKVGA